MKKGIIKISDGLYKDNWEDISVIFKDFRPTHIEFRHWENNVWYFYGESEKFDKVKEGDPIPFYDVLFTNKEDGTFNYTFTQYKQ